MELSNLKIVTTVQFSLIIAKDGIFHWINFVLIIDTLSSEALGRR